MNDQQASVQELFDALLRRMRLQVAKLGADHQALRAAQRVQCGIQPILETKAGLNVGEMTMVERKNVRSRRTFVKTERECISCGNPFAVGTTDPTLATESMLMSQFGAITTMGEVSHYPLARPARGETNIKSGSTLTKPWQQGLTICMFQPVCIPDSIFCSCLLGPS